MATYLEVPTDEGLEATTDEGLEEEEVQEADQGLEATTGGPGRVPNPQTTSSAHPQPNGRITARHARVRVRQQQPEEQTAPEEQHHKQPEEQTAQQLPQEQHQKQPEEQICLCLSIIPRIRLPGGC